LARITGFPVFPVTFSAFPRKVLSSWDHFIIPYPFSRGVFVFGEPISIDRAATEEEIEEKTLLLEKRLQEITEMADRYCEKKG
jgi:lysophospholipid acyltransferase (LPLAT)-like uncharacterized protein